MNGETENINIWVAASDGDLELVVELLKTQSANVKDSNGYSPLHASSSYGHVELIKVLITQYGADPNIIDNDGDTPLHVVQDIDTCKLLLSLGAKVDLRNNEGKLPIESAMLEGLDDVVDFLRPLSADFEELEKEPDADEVLTYLLNQLSDQSEENTVEI